MDTEIRYPFEVAFHDQIRYTIDEVEKEGKKTFAFTAHDFVSNKSTVIQEIEDRETVHNFANDFIQNL